MGHFYSWVRFGIPSAVRRECVVEAATDSGEPRNGEFYARPRFGISSTDIHYRHELVDVADCALKTPRHSYLHIAAGRYSEYALQDASLFAWLAARGRDR